MVDFRKHMTPEQLEKHDRDEAYIAKQRDKHRSMANAELVKHARHCIANSEGPRKYPAEVCVYDNAMWHFILPELIARLESVAGAADTHLEELERHLAQMAHGIQGPYRSGGGTDDCRVWTGRVDENGYPTPGVSIEIADCSLADTRRPLQGARDDEKTRAAQQGYARKVGRAIAALLNAAPELIRLAKIGKAAEVKK